MRSTIFKFSFCLFFIAITPNFVSADVHTSTVGSWQFEEGSGVTVYDLSGNSNNATINGAIWAGGRVGGGLSFDGNNDYATFSIPQFGSDFSEGTVSLWVDTSWNNSTADTFFYIYVDAQNYISIAKSNFNNILWRYNAGNVLEQGSKSFTDASGWHMLTMTFSKTSDVVKFYFDGSTGASDSTTLGTWVGTPTVKYFARSTADYGLASIDDVRIFNRVLSPSDIAELYTAGSTITAPSISSISASADSIVSTVTWKTDKVASSTVNYGLTASYGLSTTSSAYVVNHSLGLTGLSPNTTYHYEVVAEDPLGNVRTSSDGTFTTLPSDETAPVITNVASSSTQTTAIVSWTTNENSDTKIAYGVSSGNYNSSSYSGTMVTSHTVNLSSLVSGTQYYFVVVSKDSSGNIATSSEYILTTRSTDVYTAGGITIEAEDSEITSPFSITSNYVSSIVQTTDPDTSGYMTYYFTVSERDNYVIDMNVDANFSFNVYAGIDENTPTLSYFTDEATNGFEWRKLYWTESSSMGIVDLLPGNHVLKIYGGTANIKFDKIRITKMSESVSRDYATPAQSIDGNIAIMNSGLSVSQQTRSGCYYTSPYYVCGIRAGIPKLDMIVQLPKVLNAGTYYAFVKGTSAGGYNVSAGGGSTDIVVPNSADTDGLWTSLGSFVVSQNSNYLVVTTNRSVADVTENALLYGIYITDSPNEGVSDADVIINTHYPEVMDDSTANKGNLIQNSGFEVGVFSDWSITSRTAGTQGIYYVVPFSDAWDQTVYYEGSSSFKVAKNRVGTSTNQIYQNIYSKPYHLSPNKKYTISVWAKSDSGQTPSMTIGLVNSYDETTKFTSTVTVNSTWQRFSATGYAIAYPSADYKIKIFVTGGDTNVWLDNIKLEEGTLSDYTPSHDVELGFATTSVGNVFYDDEVINGLLTYYNSSSTAVSKIAKYEIHDHKNNLLQSGSINISLNSLEKSSQSIDLDVSKKGAFRFTYWIDGENGTEKEMIYSIIPRPESGVADQSFMGTHTNVSDFQLALMEKIGVHHARTLSTTDFFRWYFIEPTDDNFIWYDQVIEDLYNSGMIVTGSLDIYSVPTFAQEGNGYPNLDKWGDYISHTVDHYKNWVRYWEIDNEPNFHWPASYYAQMLKRAVDEIEAVDPTAKIVAMGGTPYSFMEDVVTNLESLYPAWNWRDHIYAFSTHAYPGGTPAETANEEIVSTYDIPVWNTETGAWDSGSYIGPFSRYASVGRQIYEFKDAESYYRGYLKKPESVVQNFLKSIGGGMTKYFYYDSRITDQPFSNQPTFLEVDDKLSIKGTVYAIAGHFIDYSISHGDLNIDSQVHAFLFDKSSHPVLSIWTKDLSNKKLTINLSASQYAVYDMMGNEISGTEGEIAIGRTPIYVTSQNVSTSSFRSAILAGTLSSRSDTEAPKVVIANGPRGAVLDNANDNIRITWFAIDDTSMPETGDLEEEQTTASTGANPNELLYSYRLTPYSTWSDWSATTLADYSSLTNGAYQFDVKAKDLAGNVSEISSRTFTVGEDVVGPVISSIVGGNTSSSGITITWTTDELSDSQIEYGLTSSYTSSSTLSSSMVTSHSIGLTGLNSGTTYHFRVISSDSFNNKTYSGDQTFTTSQTSSSGSSSGGGGGGGGGGSNPIVIVANNTIVASSTVPMLLTSCVGSTTTNINSYNFTRDLLFGSRGEDVRELQKFLNSNGFVVATSGDGSKGKESTYFGYATKQALIKFQNQYASIILKPNNLTIGNGYFGKATRTQVMQLNKVNRTIPCVTPSISPAQILKIQKTLFIRDLTVGSRGEDVRELQKFLNSNGFVVATSGDGSKGKESTYFGNLTKFALINYQTVNKIYPTSGYFGPKTRTSILSKVK